MGRLVGRIVRCPCCGARYAVRIEEDAEEPGFIHCTARTRSGVPRVVELGGESYTVLAGEECEALIAWGPGS